MNRTDIIKMVANRESVPQTRVAQVVDALMDVIELTVSMGEEVQIKGFGRFYLQQRRPRSQPVPVQRGVKTTRVVEIAERNTIAFAPSRALRARLNGDDAASNGGEDDGP